MDTRRHARRREGMDRPRRRVRKAHPFTTQKDNA
jgi:hypothetical protein